MATSRASIPLDHVLLLAHGPSNVLLRACRSAASLGAGSVAVVASTAPGNGALRRVRDRGVSIASGTGPEAVREVLADLDPEATVLVVHDDVDVSAADVDLLLLAHEEKGQVAVPHRDADSENALAIKAPTSCMVGRASQLLDVADHGAFGPGVYAGGSFVAVGTGVVHHGSCQDRLASPPPERERPLLVAAMIVRDESDNLAHCIDALLPVVDRIEIADTGSVDDTVEVAAAAGIEVMSIGWRDDFAWARNQVLERCRDAQYVLWIDADERLRVANPTRFRQSLHTFADHWESIRARVVDVDEAGEAVADVWQPRVFSPDGVHFEGALHEKVVADDGHEQVSATGVDLVIEHHGYQRAAVSAQDKFERNIALARQALAEDPTPERRAHLYRSLGRGGQSVKQARATLAEMDELIPDVSEYSRSAQALMLTLRANLCLAVDDLAEAEATARRAVDAVPADRAAVAVLVEALVRCDRPADAIAAAQAEPLDSPAPIVQRNLAAEHGIAWALLRAHLAEDDAAGALALVPALAPERDPWPGLLDSPSLDVVSAASQAATLTDPRFGKALIAHRPASSILTAVLAVFESHGGVDSLAGPVRRAILRAERIEEAPSLRAAFAQHPSAASAKEYASCVVDGEADLAAELAGLDEALDDPSAIALALGLAAEGWVRRGDPDAAVTDSVEALGHWPGAVRAGVIAASGAAASGLAEVALDIVAAVRSTSDDATDPHLGDLANVAVVAHLATGDLGAALDEAVRLSSLGGDVTTWPELIGATAGDVDHFAPVLQLALSGDGTAFIEATRQTLPGEHAAITCLSYLAAGGTNADAVTTGIVSAAVHGRDDVAELFVEHLDLVEEEQLDGIVNVLRGSGHQAVADRLTHAMN